jgi:hypothetical protein
MSFGDKTKKEETEKPDDQPKMDQTAHISFHVTGDGVGLIDWYEVIACCNDAGTPFTITSGNVNVYYTPSKKVDTPHKDLKKAEHPNKDGQDSFEVRQGGK